MEKTITIPYSEYEELKNFRDNILKDKSSIVIEHEYYEQKTVYYDEEKSYKYIIKLNDEYQKRISELESKLYNILEIVDNSSLFSWKKDKALISRI